jgi:hypothetical protein
MFNTEIVIAGIRITFWTNHQADIDSLTEIFLYHIETRNRLADPEKCHDVIITSSKERLKLPADVPLVWNGHINENTPVKWYNCMNAAENIITIEDDILIKQIPQRKLTICYLSEAKAKFFKSRRPRLTNYLFFLLHSILSMHKKYCIHAACAAKEDGAYLFLGKSGEGKTTLSVMLGDVGFEYMGDDLVFISKNEKEGVIIDAFLSKIKLQNSKSGEKESMDVIKERRFNYAYEKKLKVVLKLQRTCIGEKSILLPASQAETFAGFIRSGNNIKIQYHQQEWMDICEAASSLPAFTLLFADKKYFDPFLLNTL